jgi:hypothetical protein
MTRNVPSVRYISVEALIGSTGDVQNADRADRLRNSWTRGQPDERLEGEKMRQRMGKDPLTKLAGETQAGSL